MANLAEVLMRVQVATMDYDELDEEEMLWVLRDVNEQVNAAIDELGDVGPIDNETAWGDPEPDMGQII